MRSLIIASLLCSPVLLCAMETPAIAEGSLLEPAKTTTQLQKDLKGLNKSQVKEYFGRKPDRVETYWHYRGRWYDPDAEAYFTDAMLFFLGTPDKEDPFKITYGKCTSVAFGQW